MTIKKENKENYSAGCLKLFSYEEAWQEVWKNLKSSDKQKFLDLPHFNAKIFTEITGIEPDSKDSKKKQELLDKADELVKKANELRDKAEEI